MSITYATLYGTENDDHLTVKSVAQGEDYVLFNTIYGGEGNDLISTTSSERGGSYAFYGEGGNDWLSSVRRDVRIKLFGGDGDDSIHVWGALPEADGGDGYDKLYSVGMTLNASKIKNFEELVISGITKVGDFDLHDFQKISIEENNPDAALHFSHAVDLDDYVI